MLFAKCMYVIKKMLISKEDTREGEKRVQGYSYHRTNENEKVSQSRYTSKIEHPEKFFIKNRRITNESNSFYLDS